MVQRISKTNDSAKNIRDYALIRKGDTIGVQVSGVLSGRFAQELYRGGKGPALFPERGQSGGQGLLSRRSG